jgi:hypothetical protein
MAAWVKAIPKRDVVLRLRDDPPQPKYTIDRKTLAAALAVTLGAAFSSASFTCSLERTISRRVDLALGRLRGRID